MWNAHLTYQLSRIRISNPVEIAEQGSIEATSQRNKKNEAQELIYSNFTKVINIYAMSTLKTTILQKSGYINRKNRHATRINFNGRTYIRK